METDQAGFDGRNGMAGAVLEESGAEEMFFDSRQPN